MRIRGDRTTREIEVQRDDGNDLDENHAIAYANDYLDGGHENWQYISTSRISYNRVVVIYER